MEQPLDFLGMTVLSFLAKVYGAAKHKTLVRSWGHTLDFHGYMCNFVLRLLH